MTHRDPIWPREIRILFSGVFAGIPFGMAVVMVMLAAFAGSEPPVVDELVLEISEPIVVHTAHVPQIPTECPRCQCDPAWHAVDVRKSWERFDRASEVIEDKADDLRLSLLNCDIAMHGWSFASERWEAACRGEERACQ